MRDALRRRYWCDYCRKGGNSRHHMAIHEKGCTLNPNRVCGVCSVVDLGAKPLAELIAFVASNATWEAGPRDQKDRGFLDDERVKGLRELAGGRPVCMLAALRQAKCIASHQVFDMKKELQEVWAENPREFE